jgi:hypothetical protein
MAWVTPKTDWATDDAVGTTDLNRIEGNLEHLSSLGEWTYTELLVDCAGTNAASVDLTADIPAKSMILSAQMNAQTAVTLGGGSAGVYLGVSDGAGAASVLLGKLLKSGATILKNTKSDRMPFTETGTIAFDVRVYSTTDTSAALPPEGGVFTGTIRVKIVYATLTSLPDAA